jgi:hypothetical protein
MVAFLENGQNRSRVRGTGWPFDFLGYRNMAFPSKSFTMSLRRGSPAVRESWLGALGRAKQREPDTPKLV